MSKHHSWLDALKGLCILTVVAGHSGSPFFHHYFFWFHMPLFFMISGYLFHPRSRIQEVREWILKKWMRLLVPYFSFGLLIAALIFLQTFNVREVLLNIYHLCIGGRTLGYYYGVFWFVTCLFLTHLIFAYAALLIKRKSSMVLFLALCYFIAHIYVSFPFLQQKNIIWSANSVLLSICYYAIGYYSRQAFSFVERKSTVMLSSLIILLIVALEKLNVLSYTLDIKANIYTWLLDLIIPLCAASILVYISKKMSLTKWSKPFEYVGRSSFTIMFLHVPVTILVEKYTGISTVFLYIVMGTLIPLICHVLLKQFLLTNALFLGALPIPKKDSGQTLPVSK
ncbi:acyltransferase family protein [Priestia megaterium]|uniref:acyltransferase family protein n=1 Tax=Priestia megaterium TaxID=1404 RepID=UPI002FFF69D9